MIGDAEWRGLAGRRLEVESSGEWAEARDRDENADSILKDGVDERVARVVGFGEGERGLGEVRRRGDWSEDR